jgi:hypothetical protein
MKLRDENIDRVQEVLRNAGVPYTSSPSGREIKFGTKQIKVNHNGAYHWTIRVPGAAKDGIRLKFGSDLAVADGLFIIGDCLAIKYD